MQSVLCCPGDSRFNGCCGRVAFVSRLFLMSSITLSTKVPNKTPAACQTQLGQGPRVFLVRHLPPVSPASSCPSRNTTGVIPTSLLLRTSQGLTHPYLHPLSRRRAHLLSRRSKHRVTVRAESQGAPKPRRHCQCHLHRPRNPDPFPPKRQRRRHREPRRRLPGHRHSPPPPFSASRLRRALPPGARQSSPPRRSALSNG